MRMVDIIEKKKEAQVLSKEEIQFFIDGVVDGSIPDYQTTALLMAICFQGLNDEETLQLTLSMVNSGDKTDLSSIPGIKVDKHSTGGVGDKTTLILAPLVAACGVPVAKMSGRGLGHTGGTIDKLESIPGFSTSLSLAQFIENVKSIGLAIAGQTGHLVPADKKLYALRDVTSTINNVSLIAASIMSKKIASGADAIILDVKVGSGAFMQTVAEAELLAKTMVRIGTQAGRKTVAILTDMDMPLGLAIGNTLEVKEAINVLKGNGPKDVTDLCLYLGSMMLQLAGVGDEAFCDAKIEHVLSSGEALQKFREMVSAQGGDPDIASDLLLLGNAAFEVPYKAKKSGYIQQMLSSQLGMASMVLGAGRRTKEDSIDPTSGIVLIKKTGEQVAEGEMIAVLYTNEPERLEEAGNMMDEAVVISSEYKNSLPLIMATIV